MVHFAHEAETRTVYSSIVLLDELSETIQGLRDSLQLEEFLQVEEVEEVSDSTLKFTVQEAPMMRMCQSFLSFAVQRDLQIYVT